MAVPDLATSPDRHKNAKERGKNPSLFCCPRERRGSIIDFGSLDWLGGTVGCRMGRK